MTSKKLFTLVFVRKEVQVLLGLKKRGFGIGRWNGFGGKVEAGEDTRSAAVRELREECELRVSPENLHYRGHLEFTFCGQPTVLVVKVFIADEFGGTPTETDEMKPAWFDETDLPFKDMWPDDQLWFPYLLDRKSFTGKFYFKGMNEITHYDLKAVKFDELTPIDELNS